MYEFDYLANQPAVGQCAKELRISYGLTQEQFAEYAGTSRQSINSFENGNTQSMPILQAYISLSKGDFKKDDHD